MVQVRYQYASLVTAFTLMLVLATFSGYSQVNTTVQILTPQEQHYLTTAKSVHKEYKKLHRRYIKDSTRAHKQLLKQSLSSPDLGSNTCRGCISEEGRKQFVEKQIKWISDSLYKTYNLESLEPIASNYEQYKEGTMDWKEFYSRGKPLAEKRLSQYDDYGQVSKLTTDVTQHTGDLNEYKVYIDNPDSLLTDDKLDQLAEQQLLQLDEMQELQQQSEALEAVKHLPKEYQEMYKQYYEQAANPDKETIKSEVINHAKTLGQKFVNEHGDVVSSAQSKLSKLKKKYSYISSSNDLTNAVKSNSLSDEPPGKRIIFGGNFQVSRTAKQTNLDISPIVGYKFTKKVSIGIGGVYRVTFGQHDEFFHYVMEENVYGGRIFFEYKLIKGFFGHGEYERMNNVITDPLTDITYRIWSDGILVGLGKGYRISNVLSGNVMVLYNTTHKAGVSPYNSPWQVRFSFGKL